MRTVIVFDISKNRLRYRVVKELLSSAHRVQKSVFEAPHLGAKEYLRLRSQCEGAIDPETDSLRYYRLCAACAARIEHSGAGPGVMTLPLPFEVIG